MSNRDLSLALRLYTDTARFVAGLTQAGGGVRKFAHGAKRELDALKSAMSSLHGQLAQLGLSVGAVALAAQSARMDKSLTQIGQTAGMSQGEVAKLRTELFRMSGETGQSVDDLQSGFNNAVQAGLKFKEALPVIEATNVAMAVTGASADRLTSGLTVAATAFNFDLAKPDMALTLLDKMTVAGRLGKAELQSLSDIFARVGVNAASAGMSFDKTLAFIEGLSQIEPLPERLATLADSTLRLFTNLNYMKEAAKSTGVKFFDAKGERRDALAVLGDIKAKYDKLKTDKERAVFVQNAFGKADLDTIKGLKTLLGGDMLSNVKMFSAEIGSASGMLTQNLGEAIGNAVDQTGRLKTELRKAADDFSKPINNTLSRVIKWGLDKKENGGLGLDGKDMIGGGAALTLGTLAAARYGGKGVQAMIKRFGGTAVGLAEGKALEAAAGVTPVFVVNWPGSIGGLQVPGTAPGTPSGATSTSKTGKAAALLSSGLVGYEFGTQLNDNFISGTKAGDIIGRGVAGVLAFLGNGEAQESLAMEEMYRQKTDAENGSSSIMTRLNAFFGDDNAKAALAMAQKREVNGVIRVRVDQDGRVSSITARSENSGISMNVDPGYSMVTP